MTFFSEKAYNFIKRRLQGKDAEDIFTDKGKPVEKRGRKAPGLRHKICDDGRAAKEGCSLNVRSVPFKIAGLFVMRRRNKRETCVFPGQGKNGHANVFPSLELQYNTVNFIYSFH